MTSYILIFDSKLIIELIQGNIIYDIVKYYVGTIYNFTYAFYTHVASTYYA